MPSLGVGKRSNSDPQRESFSPFGALPLLQYGVVPSTLEQAMVQATLAGVDLRISFQVKVLVETKDAGKLFGQGGSVLKRVQRVSGCTRIHFSQPKDDHRKAILQGPAPAIVIGLSLFSLLLCGETIQTRARINLLINANRVGQVIGKAGSRINQIRKESGAEISISSERFRDDDFNTEDNKITISGAPMGVSKAISRIVFHLQQSVEETLKHSRGERDRERPRVRDREERDRDRERERGRESYRESERKRDQEWVRERDRGSGGRYGAERYRDRDRQRDSFQRYEHRRDREREFGGPSPFRNGFQYSSSKGSKRSSRDSDEERYMKRRRRERDLLR
eukprot:CAMPEP_0184489250 /NCGR_PEP_ID=MMETSP0113_2-20130426/14943_1 /TAXON_ID=91329 /ORGANISM="Norrisiella sphaerica, Strain BC52" /LENGTH=336 /DNA_ID=CAMNT_0026872571 /DNA_START=1301 /DNA_END=2311 /DNA_ORIENTATION=-